MSEEKLSEEKTKRRRESQIRASRTYRLKKKEYLKEMECKLHDLQIENSTLRSKNQYLESQILVVIKPAPLLRSYSDELQNIEKEIEVASKN